jgi:hypothetical protein
MASLIFRPDLRFLAVTLLQSRTRPNFSFGSSSLISLRRQSFSVSRPRFRPPGNIHSRSRLRRTRRTLPRFTATSFDDFAIGTNSTRVGSDRLVTTEPHFTAPKCLLATPKVAYVPRIRSRTAGVLDARKAQFVIVLAARETQPRRRSGPSQLCGFQATENGRSETTTAPQPPLEAAS